MARVGNMWESLSHFFEMVARGFGWRSAADEEAEKQAKADIEHMVNWAEMP